MLEQLPLLQMPVEQTCPQLPQLLGSLARLAEQVVLLEVDVTVWVVFEVTVTVTAGPETVV